MNLGLIRFSDIELVNRLRLLPTKVATVTLQEGKKCHGICHHAMRENDINELLKIVRALDQATEQEQREAVQGKELIGLGKALKT